MTVDIAALDAMPAGEFVSAVGPLFEGAPGFLYRLAAARPYGSPACLFERAREIAQAMPEPLKVELVDAHPRLGAPPATVSEMSFREQGYDAEAAANLEDEAARERERVAADLDRLNQEYEARFGFRFCVFVNGRSRPELVPVLEAAINADRDAEIRRALVDVVAIARDRARKHEADAGVA